jgi:hypothetical protein
VIRDAFPLVWFREQCSVLRQRGSAALQRARGAAAPAGRQGLQTIKETSRKTFARLRATPWQALARRHWKLFFLVIVAVIAVGIIWKVPQWQTAGWQGQMEPKDLAKLQNDARTTLIQGLGGAVLLIGLYFTLRNLQLTQDRQITEHYTHAVEHLGSDKLAMRLAAIYALERIARDSERDHWPIMEILTAYVREHAPRKAGVENHGTQLPKLAPDIQAILTVIGRRTRTYGKGEDQRLNLSGTNLQGAVLVDAQLQGATLDDVQLRGARAVRIRLQGATLWDAQLQEATLYGGQLQGAIFSGTRMERTNLGNAQFQGAELLFARLYRAVLVGAQFQGARLDGARLRGADLRKAQLQDANLEGARLVRARNLTIEQLSTVKTLYEAHLDPPLLTQIQQQYPHLLEKPQD